MSKIRKAIAGGISGGLAAAGAGLTFTGAPTKEQIGNLVGLFAGGFFLGFITVYTAKANEVTR